MTHCRMVEEVVVDDVLVVVDRLDVVVVEELVDDVVDDVVVDVVDVVLREPGAE